MKRSGCAATSLRSVRSSIQATACTSSRLKPSTSTRVGEVADEDVHALVLDQAAADVGAVVDDSARPQLGVQAELLEQPAPGAVGRALAPMRMRAAGVGPQPAAMILAVGALLDQQLVAGEDEDRYGQVLLAQAMRLQLAHREQRAVGRDRRDCRIDARPSTRVAEGTAPRLARRAQATARASAQCDHRSARAPIRWSMSASVCSGDGVMRSRSVLRGTVG